MPVPRVDSPPAGDLQRTADVCGRLVSTSPQQVARVLEGPVPDHKVLLSRGGEWNSSGNGAGGTTYGLPRFRDAEFLAPISLRHAEADRRGRAARRRVDRLEPLHAAGGRRQLAARRGPGIPTYQHVGPPRGRRVLVSLREFPDVSRANPAPQVRPIPGGFVAEPTAGGERAVAGSGLLRLVRRSRHAGRLRLVSRRLVRSADDGLEGRILAGEVVSRGPHEDGPASKGASLYVPFKLEAGQSKTIRLLFAWYVPRSNIRTGDTPPRPTSKRKSAEPECCPDGECCPAEPRPRTTSPGTPTIRRRRRGARLLAQQLRPSAPRRRPRFATVSSTRRCRRKWSRRSRPTCRSSRAPPACGSTTVASGAGKAAATRTAAAAAVARTCGTTPRRCRICSPAWNVRCGRRRSLACQNERGHQTFRTPLPIGPATHDFHAAADGQLGHVMRVYREWRISGDTAWMVALWPQVKQSLDYCIEAWDPEHQGTLREPHHNTYDIEFWGPDGMCTSMYLGALEAADPHGQRRPATTCRSTSNWPPTARRPWNRSCSTASTSSRRSNSKGSGPPIPRR